MPGRVQINMMRLVWSVARVVCAGREGGSEGWVSPKVSSGYRRQPMLVGNLQVVGSILRPVDFGSGNGRGVVHVKIVA